MKNINKLYFKIVMLCKKLGIFFYKLRGLHVGSNTKIGKILIKWPNKLSIGDNSEILDYVYFGFAHPFNDKNYVKVGNNTFIGFACEFNCSTTITIGDNCLIASKTTFVDAGHEFDRRELIKNQSIPVEQIIIKDDVWIGTSCTILKGVTIGEGSVVAASSLVNKNIPSYEVWGGIPAKFIKKRT